MSIRTKILLSVVSVAIVNTLAIAAIAVFNTGSAAVVASVAAALFVMAVVIGLRVANSVAAPLNAVIGTLGEMSRGHLGARLNLNRGDELGVTAKAINAFANNLRVNVIGAINKIAAGDLSAKIALRDDDDEINYALKRATDSLRKLIVDDGGRVLAAAADKDLSRRLTGVYNGDFAVMRDNINAVMQDFDDTLRRAAETAVSQISSASSLEAVSQNIEAVSTITKRNADSSKQAKLLADEERAAVNEGNAAVKRVANAVSRIKASSDNTAKIVKAIDDITAEANLLAFNVDIEAAHAGDAGAGITRVAAEARDLATHCADAAKRAADILEESARTADGGVKITEDAAKTLCKIADSADKVDGLIAEIAEASSKQARGIELVSTAVSQINQANLRNITDGFLYNAGNAAGQRGRRNQPARQIRGAAFPNKKAYTATPLGLMVQAGAADSGEMVTIDDCELWR